MEKVGIIPKSEHDFSLCDEAEERLYTSIENNATMLVNGHLVLKFVGRLAALCIKDFTGPNGEHFYEGVWYSPYDKKTRSLFKRDFKRGIRLTQGFETGQWAQIRMAVTTYIFDERGGSKELSKSLLIEKARIHAADIAARRTVKAKAPPISRGKNDIPARGNA